MDSQKQDEAWMRRALRLAERGFTPPNPMVGCVLVRDGENVGEGWHPFAGQPHAEVFALRAAGERAQNATAYVTLEPCSHWGRTPPCADALIAAHVARVVTATLDTNPKVSGSGLAKLQEAGIAVTTGVLEQEARRLNEAFFHFHAAHSPLVTLKAAMTLDGKIAARTGDSKWITGAAARRYVHKMRAQSGAVLAGIGTVLADDALLTARLLNVKLPRQPLRIIVDSQLRTPPHCRAVQAAVQSPDFAPLLIAATDRADRERENDLLRPGVEIRRLPANAEGRVDLSALMQFLAERQIISVLAEGGGALHAGLLAENLAHKALFFYAPKIVGGRDALTAVEGDGKASIAEADMLDAIRLRRFGNDFAIEGTIRAKTELSGKAAKQEAAQ